MASSFHPNIPSFTKLGLIIHWFRQILPSDWSLSPADSSFTSLYISPFACSFVQFLTDGRTSLCSHRVNTWWAASGQTEKRDVKIINFYKFQQQQQHRVNTAFDTARLSKTQKALIFKAKQVAGDLNWAEAEFGLPTTLFGNFLGKLTCLVWSDQKKCSILMSLATYVALSIASNEILSNFPRKNRSFSYTYDTAILPQLARIIESYFRIYLIREILFYSQ